VNVPFSYDYRIIWFGWIQTQAWVWAVTASTVCILVTLFIILVSVSFHCSDIYIEPVKPADVVYSFLTESFSITFSAISNVFVGVHLLFLLFLLMLMLLLLLSSVHSIF